MMSFLEDYSHICPAAPFLLLPFRVSPFSFYMPVPDFVTALSHPYFRKKWVRPEKLSAERFLKRGM
jgi:hypothetical protein